ncbi:extracellular solute-binding protein [Gorillibacterium sp. sgz500922]|uniref:extracellular solute-binding protein n=1 Tax=Gorillibacterium sp. sgz500922 TaxID=3446694 RepID=UPI003F67B3D7
MNNKQAKKWAATAMSVTLITATILTGCGKSASDSGASADPAASGASAKPGSASAKAMPIEIMEVGWSVTNTLPKPADDFVKQGLDKALNTDIKLTLSATPEEMIQKLNVRAAGGDLPDVIEFKDKTQYEEYAKKNLLLDLTPYMDKLADVKSAIGDQTFERSKVNGKIYAVSKNPTAYYPFFWIRKDWLDHLGLPVPKTLDEVVEVSKAFTEKDPDGNNKKDTFGITGQLGMLSSVVTNLHGTADNFYLKDGKMVHGLYEPEMKAAISYMNKLLATGSVDPEIASNKPENAKDKAFQGKAGIFVGDWSLIMKNEEKQKWKAANPNADWVMVSDLTGPGGSMVGQNDTAVTSGFVTISKAAAKDETKLNKILEMLNYMAKGDGSLLVQFGVKDTHFTLGADGKAVLTDKSPEAAYTYVYQLAGRPEKDYLSTKFPEQKPYIEANDAAKLIEIFGGYITLPAGYNSADAERFKQEELLKFYYGKNKLESFDAFLKKLDTTFQYKTYRDSAMSQLKELGFAP